MTARGHHGARATAAAIALSSVATLNLSGVTLTGNTASESGGAIAAYHTSTGGTVNIDSSSISGNTAGTAAGATRHRRRHLHRDHGEPDQLARSRATSPRAPPPCRAAGWPPPWPASRSLNSTIAGNSALSTGAASGGGIANAASLNATNTIVADNIRQRRPVGLPGGRDHRHAGQRPVQRHELRLHRRGQQAGREPGARRPGRQRRPHQHAQARRREPRAGRGAPAAAARPPTSAAWRAPRGRRATSARWSWRRPGWPPAPRRGSTPPPRCSPAR